MSDEEANSGTTSPQEGFKLTGTIVRESFIFNSCSNPLCRCNKPKEKKIKKCWFRHNYHLDNKTKYYTCTRCGDIETGSQ